MDEKLNGKSIEEVAPEVFQLINPTSKASFDRGDLRWLTEYYPGVT
jgi:hypothetical protein